MSGTALLAGRFPFGRASIERPPRRPDGAAVAFVLGAYPSALHVRWRQPRWLREEASVTGQIANLAVDVEPSVFWDGHDVLERVAEWKRMVGFREGDERGAWGHVVAAGKSGNGSSGRAVQRDVLAPLRLDERAVWFSDVVPYYLVKRRGRGGKGREQGDAMDEDYAPLAARDPNVPAASLPKWLDVDAIAAWGIAHRRRTLREELLESGAELVITLGEAARRVVADVADFTAGGACQPLVEKMTEYGEPGRIELGARSMQWRALIHPGQRGRGWERQRQKWIDGLG